MASGDWIAACRLSDLKEGRGKQFLLSKLSDSPVAIFRHKGTVYALEDSCCHKQKTIHGGDIESLDECVIGRNGEVGVGGVCVQCPRHQKKFGGGLFFNLETGRACTPKFTKKFSHLDCHHITAYDVACRAGEVFLRNATIPTSHLKRRKVQQLVYEVEDEPPEPVVSVAPDPLVQCPDEHIHCNLAKIERVNHDTLLFSLCHPLSSALPTPPQTPIWHTTLYALLDGKVIERDYTPLSDWSEWRDAGRIRLLVKIYPQGQMTQHLYALPVGSTIEVTSPRCTLLTPTLMPPESAASVPPPEHVVLLAAGTGIIPMLQIIREVLSNGDGIRTVTLLCSNKSYDDLLCWEELCSLHTQHGGPVLSVWLAFSSVKSSTINSTPKGWPCMGVVHSRIDQALLEKALPTLKDCRNTGSFRAIVSGPDGFFEAMKDAFPAHAREIGTFVNLDE